MARVFPGVERMAARAPDVQRGLQALAEEIAVAAASNAGAHADSGEYGLSFRVTRGRVDRFVSSDDPAALSKEYGRTGARGRGESRGTYALTRAVAERR